MRAELPQHTSRWASVQWVFSTEKYSHDFSNLSTDAIENMFHFLKREEPKPLSSL